jgi:hypothetical protein
MVLLLATAAALATAAPAPRAAATGDELRTVGSGFAATARPLATGFLDPETFRSPEQSVALEHARRAGATYVRVLLHWPRVAPGGATPPAGFDATDPGDPRYQWTSFDQELRAIPPKRLVPLIYVQGAPAWAQQGPRLRPNDGPTRPSPVAVAEFFTALATRYSGSYGGLPRVRHWQIWNEPNLNIQLNPQLENGRPVSPALYREIVNAAGRALHAVRPDNVVIAGALAPFGGNSNDPSGGVVPNQERIRPLQFMREMLCMSKGARPRPTCNQRTEFDVWAHHPYTYGGPTHSAFHPDDVSLGDLGAMRTLLEAAERAGHIRSRQKVSFWVTEFSYDSRPADPKGLAPALHARWTSEALYRMWQNGVSLVTWFLLRDEPFPDQMFQSGLYMRGASGIASDKPKPALRAFRFPFVAFRETNRSVTYWGRTPTSTRKAVVVEQKRGARWMRVAMPRVDRYGILQGRVAGPQGSGALRARLVDGSDVSLPFGLKVPKDFRFCPWGSFC